MYDLIEGRYGREYILYNIDKELCDNVTKINLAYEKFNPYKNYDWVKKVKSSTLRRIKKIRLERGIDVDIENWHISTGEAQLRFSEYIK